MNDNCKLQFNVEHQHINRIDRRPVVASNTKNCLIAKFSFSDEWDEFDTRYAVFRKNGISYSVELNDEKECVIPWEVLIPGRFTLGVYGGDLYTSDGIEITVDKGMYDDSMVSSLAPSETIYTSLLKRIEAIELMLGIVTPEDPDPEPVPDDNENGNPEEGTDNETNGDTIPDDNSNEEVTG